MAGRKTVLIVDDEAFVVKVLKAKFREQKLSVIEAFDGEEGLEKAFAKRPDIIVLDLIMPKMDGMAMLKKLRQDHWGKDVPVVVLSNLNTAKAMEESMDSGAHVFLVKVDHTLDEVVDIVKRKLGV